MNPEKSYDIRETKFLKAEADIYKQFHPSVQESLKQIIAKEGYQSYEISKNVISTEGGNYFGDLYEVDIKGKTANGIKDKNLFVKQAIRIKTTDSVINIHTIYQNELFIYTELGKIYNILQDEAGIPQNERFKMAKSYDESNVDAIILENLTRKGFAIHHRMDVVSLSFAVASIKEIAKFHSLSILLAHTQSDYCNKKLKKLKSPMQFNDSMTNLIEMISDGIVKHFDSSIGKKLKKFSGKVCEKLREYLQGNTGSVKCLCHADFRVNNILFKEKNLESEEVILIDYQLIFWGSPVFDLLYFFYVCTDRKFRKDHMTYLKDIYHDTLRDYLKYFNIDVHDIYPKKVFLEDFEEQLEAGLIVAFYALPFCFTREDDLPDFKNEVAEIKINLHEGFVERFKGIVDDYLEWGII